MADSSLAVTACLVWLALRIFPQPAPAAYSPVGLASAQKESSPQANAPKQTRGEEARRYLEQTGEGQSLMAAVTKARFGLKWQEHGPFGVGTGGGYLGMSHVQNLNAWFDEGGATIRPTVSEKERAKAWQLGLRFNAYGYGDEMQAAPPITARNVKGQH